MYDAVVSGKRTYDDGCGIAHAMNLIGDRWAVLIVRDLLLGPKRFTDLQAGLRTVGANALAQRLRDLEQSGVVRRRVLPPPAGSRVYELTDWGAQLQAVLAELARWGLASPIVPPSGDVGADSLMLGLRTFYNPALMPTRTATLHIVLDDAHFTARLAKRHLDIERGQPRRADITVQTDRASFTALLGKTAQVGDLVRKGHVHITGDVAIVEEMVAATCTPQPAQVQSGNQPA